MAAAGRWRTHLPAHAGLKHLPVAADAVHQARAKAPPTHSLVTQLAGAPVCGTHTRSHAHTHTHTHTQRLSFNSMDLYIGTPTKKNTQILT